MFENMKLTYTGMRRYEKLTGNNFYDVVQMKRASNVLDVYAAYKLSDKAPAPRTTIEDYQPELEKLINKYGIIKVTEKLAKLAARDLMLESNEEKKM